MTDLAQAFVDRQSLDSVKRHALALPLPASPQMLLVEWSDVFSPIGMCSNLMGGANTTRWKQTVTLQSFTAFTIAGPLELRFEGLDKELATFALIGLGAYKLGDATSTTSPTDCSILFAGWRPWTAPNIASPPANDAVPSTPATRLLTRVKQASDLTYEAIAPLMGVSRRTLHSWQAGHPISLRNEERLRTLCESVEIIAAQSPEAARERIMRRIPGSVRVYDLLAEGRYDEATKRATGAKLDSRPAVHAIPRAPSTPLLSQIASLDDVPALKEPTLDRRLTRRLGR